MNVESIIKKELLDRPKRANQLVDACAGKGFKRSSVFYWLKKMRKDRVIRKVEGEYVLIKFDNAEKEAIGFLMVKMRNRSPHVRKAAIEDFAALCRERRVANNPQVLSFVRDMLKSPQYPELKEAALRFLRFITVNSKRTQDAQALRELVEFKELLKALVLNQELALSLRYDATLVLDVLLNDDEIQRLIELLEMILKESARTPEGEVQAFQVVGLYVWKSILKRTRYPLERNALREMLYEFLEHEDRRVREISLRLLDELRMKEYGFERL